MKEYIDRVTSELFPEMIEWRRYLHQHPELSYQEKETSRFIADKLISFGLTTQEKMGGYGVTGLLKGTKPGPTIALRADMDALPIQDAKTCSYASTVPGVMHACGHDGHVAALLGAAKLLSGLTDQLAGNVLFIFQPAEEVTPGGAKEMIKAGVLDGVEVIYGIHLWTPLAAGTAAVRSGAFMAAADEFELVIRGKGGHGGLPHKSIDSLVIGAQLVMNLQTVVSRSLNPVYPGVVTIGSMEAGNGFNVIADRCVLKGTVRTFDEESRQLARERIERIIDHTVSMHGGEFTLDYKMGYPPLVNDAEETTRFSSVAKEILGESAVVESELIMAAEDFSYYVREIPGCFLFVGAGGSGAEYGHHHPGFDIIEESIRTASRLFCTLVLKRIGSS